MTASSGCATAPAGSSCSPSRAGAARPASATTGGSLRSSGRGRWTLRVRGKRGRSYELQASLGTLKQPLRPCRVLVDGRRLPRLRLGLPGGEELLTAQFSGARAKLTVIGPAPAAAAAEQGPAPGRDEPVPLLPFPVQAAAAPPIHRTTTPEGH